MGVISIYLLLNLMSDGGIDATKVTSVLGYCLLPLCLLSAINVFVKLKCVPAYTDQQRHVWPSDFALVHSMVLHICIRHLCFHSQHAQSKVFGRLPGGTVLRLLCSA